MSKKIKGNLWLLLIAAISLSAVGFATTRILPRQPSATAKSDTRENQSNSSAGRGYVNRGRLSPKLAMHLNALGNRLEKTGKERLTITGELRSSWESQVQEITATLELPDKLRLDIQNGHQTRLITFDKWEIKGEAASDELDLIESLIYDSAEHFFATQMQGNATRFLGSRFRTDDGSTTDYAGPYFDIYRIADQIKTSGQERATKLYYFNSDTFLLDHVTYVINREGSEINVETKLSDWRAKDGQQVARRVERFENGKSVLVLTIRSAQLSSRADDGIFQQ